MTCLQELSRTLPTYDYQIAEAAMRDNPVYFYELYQRSKQDAQQPEKEETKQESKQKQPMRDLDDHSLFLHLLAARKVGASNYLRTNESS